MVSSPSTVLLALHPLSGHGGPMQGSQAQWSTVRVYKYCQKSSQAKPLRTWSGPSPTSGSGQGSRRDSQVQIPAVCALLQANSATQEPQVSEALAAWPGCTPGPPSTMPLLLHHPLVPRPKPPCGGISLAWGTSSDVAHTPASPQVPRAQLGPSVCGVGKPSPLCPPGVDTGCSSAVPGLNQVQRELGCHVPLMDRKASSALTGAGRPSGIRCPWEEAQWPG